GLHYAIVDEIDSILIDEARTPLIISGRANQSSDLYKKADNFVKRLTPKVIVEEDVKDFDQAEDNENYDYIVDLKAKSASLTLKGIKKAEEAFGLENFNDLENSTLVHHVNQALRAHGVMKKDIDYIVKDGEVLIVDEFTGRIMYGRRYNNGLHQAIEAKEHVKIADESKTLATITFQNYFRMYDKLSGMTGTAMTEEAEFEEIYNLDVVEIPTNKPMVRKDENDVIYKNEKAKFNAIVNSIKESHKKGQPVLVGTVSIEKSEKLSKLLQKEGIKHEVLNAKYHEKEAEIVAQAGKFGAVTIATNMAGRGTDIILGGNSEFLAKEEMRKNKVSHEIIEEANTYYETEDQEIIKAREEFKKLVNKYDEEIKEEKEKVIQAGGLKIIGTERHESRRIDNQLRGRSGRQGDVGESKFYIALDDDLMKIFGGDTITKVYNSIGADENMPIESRIISKAVENAQKKVEGRNFTIRKNVLKYDDVMNAQREIIYAQRKEVLDGANLHDNIVDMINAVAEATVNMYIENNDGHNVKINVEALNQEIINNYGIDMSKYISEHSTEPEKISEELIKQANEKYQQKEEEVGSDDMRELERIVMLKVVDEKWMNHIDSMDELKDGIGLRAYGQQDPVVKYRIEGMDMFEEMISDIKSDVTKIIMNIRQQGETKRQETVKITGAALEAIHSVDGGSKIGTDVDKTIRNEGPKVGRNDPCPCGSGKKYKNCCGRNQ
ncbi:MAG: preprotein translocase subunit SecA, partial [Clostridia bacterium]